MKHETEVGLMSPGETPSWNETINTMDTTLEDLCLKTPVLIEVEDEQGLTSQQTHYRCN